MAELWDELGRERYGVDDERTCASATACRSTRSGLTEAQPENNVQRIVLEALGVTLGRDARARAIQLPGLERGARAAAPVGPAVVAAHPAGARLRDRPARVPRHLRGLEGDGRARRRAARGRARARWRVVAEHGGAVEAVPYMKAALVESHRERVRRDRGGRADRRRHEPLHRDRALAADRGRRGRHPRRRPRGRGRADRRAARLARGARPGRGRRRARASSRACRARERREHHARDDRRRPRRARRPASGRGALRDVFGEYRAPTGVGEAAGRRATTRSSRSCATRSSACRRRSAGG